MLEELLKAPFWIDIENWPLSWEIGGTSWFPFLESIHVIAAALLVGAIATIDLRLLGVGAVRYPLSTLGREILPWVWGAFMIATITGLGMFITRAASHVVNPAFQWKIFLLALAGINMLHLHAHIALSAMATFNPSRIWARSSASFNSNSVLRIITIRLKSKK